MSQILLFKKASPFVQRLAPLGARIQAFSSSKQIPDKSDTSLIQEEAKNELNLNIPKTEFNPRFHAAVSETQYHPLTTSYLYNWQKQRETKKNWNIHDLPMMVHERLHVGHFYNKIIKDVINRYKVLKGFKVDFSMGFNCHGMVIENMALREEMQKEEPAGPYSELEIREISRKHVNERLKDYMGSLQRWGIMTDFKSSYLTMHPLYEACVLDIFYDLVDKKLIYRDARPMFWSVTQKRPVHEDEIEHKYESKPGIFVKFKVTDYGSDKSLAEKYPNLYFIVYTTEPWTLTGCKAISLHPIASYAVNVCTNGEQYIMATTRYPSFRENWKKIGGVTNMKVLGNTFGEFKVKDPIMGREIGICFDESIKPSIGSGINSVSPAHFVDDMKLADDFGLDKEGYIDESGCFTEDVGDELKGKNVLQNGTNAIKKKLAAQGDLLDFKEESETVVFTHFKTKEKIIIRTSDQWFCRIPQYVKEDLLEALTKVKHTGVQGKEDYNSLIKEIENKGEEWCISSRHTWGIPIPVFHLKDQKGKKVLLDKTVVSYVRKNFEQYGSDIWWKWSVMDLLPPKYKDRADLFEKGNLVFDNWFESGTAWYAILCKKINEKQKINVDQDGEALSFPAEAEIIEEDASSAETSQQDDKEKFPADLVIEGLDQNDGTLQSMCLVAANTREEVPFLELKNHAVIVDKEFNKISKLAANRILMEDIIKGVEKANDQRQYGGGADVARLWVAAADNTVLQYENVNLNTEAIDIKNAEINLIRKIYWSLLRYTSNFKIGYSADAEYRSPIDRLLMLHLQLYMHNVEKAYEQYDLSKAYRLFMDFMKFYVLDIYLETIRHRMIAEPGTKRQKSAQRVSALILENTLLSIAPILCHNAENIYSHINFKETKESIFQNNWPAVSVNALGPAKDLIPMFATLMEMRENVISQYDNIAQRAKYNDTKFFEVCFFVNKQSPAFEALQFLKDDLEDFFKCSKATIIDNNQNPQMATTALSSFKYKGNYEGQRIEVSIKIFRTAKHKCIRCHKYKNDQDNQVCSDCSQFLPKNENPELPLPEN